MGNSAVSMNQIHKLAAECGISICQNAKGMLQVMCTIPELEEFAERSLAKANARIFELEMLLKVEQKKNERVCKVLEMKV